MAIDISEINNTAELKKPKTQRFLMANIRDQFKEYHKLPGNIQQYRYILYFDNGKVMGSYSADLTTKAGNSIGKYTKRRLDVKVGQGLHVQETEDLRQTYLVAVEDLAAGDQEKLPIPDWFLSTFKEVGLEDLSVLPWQGVFVDKGPNPEDIADGYLKIIDDEKTATKITVALGNLYELSAAATDYNTSNIRDELRNQFFAMPAKSQKRGISIYIPYRYKEIYKEAIRTEYPNRTDGDVPTEYLDGTDKKAKFIWHEDMGDTTKKVVMTRANILTYGMDGLYNEFGKPIAFWYQGNPNIMGIQTKVVLGFQIGTLDKREFIVNNL